MKHLTEQQKTVLMAVIILLLVAIAVTVYAVGEGEEETAMLRAVEAVTPDLYL